MNNMAWYLTRATGIVATALAVASLVLGFFFSSRNTGNRRRPAWWLDFHNWLGGLTLVFTGAHVVAAYLDTDRGLGLADALIPGALAYSTWAMAWGIIAAYLFAITVFTSWPRKRLNRRNWRIVHLTSVVATVLAGVHAVQLGSDGTTVALEVALVAGAAVTVYAAGVRVLALNAAKG